MNWNELSKTVHQNAIEKGFWKEKLSDDHYLMLVITEISEAVEAHRRCMYANIEDYKLRLKETTDNFDESGFKWYIKDSIADELADVAIRLLDLSGAKEIEIKPYECFFTEESKEKSFTENALYLTYLVQCCSHIPNGKTDGWNYSVALGFLVGWCKHLSIDLEWHIEQKMKYNALREPMHGKKY